MLKKFKTNKNKLENIKTLTNWLIDKQQLADSQLCSIIDNNYKYRIFSYLIKHPRLLDYVNNNLNNLYVFNSNKYSDLDWLNTFKLIFHKYNITSLNNIQFMKFKQSKRTHFKNLVSDYEFDDNTISELFRLYSANIITNETINKLSDKNVKNFNIVATNINQETPKKLSENISKFNTGLSKLIDNRLLCKNCPLFGRPRYPIVSNIENEKDTIDCIIVNEYPFSDNYITSNEYYNYINVLFKKYNLKYIATNLVACMPVDSDIPNKNKTINNCEGIQNHIYTTFNVGFKILIGASVKSKFKIKDAYNKSNGKIINNNFIINSPLNNLSQYKAGIIELDKYLQKYSKDKLSRINNEQNMENTEVLNTSDIQDYTLFDIKIINNKVLYVLLNDKGGKKYIVEDISFPIYIKKGNFKDCDYMIEYENSDFKFFVTNQQKMHLQNLLNKDLNSKIVELNC